MSNLKQRVITGFILVLCIIITISWSKYSFIGLILAINVLSLLEFYSLFKSDSLSPNTIPGIILSIGMLLTAVSLVMGFTDWSILLVNVLLSFLIFIAELFRSKSKPFHNLAFTFLGIIYITIPLCFFLCIGFIKQAPEYISTIVTGCFLIIWAHDSSAYLTGKTWGKTPLFKRISPGKTWEGSLGGSIAAVLISFVISNYFHILNFTQWLIIAAIIIVAGTFGDLIKSMMKRSLNLKDSGTILPGHGGMLDRFDTLFGSSPIIFIYLILSIDA